MTTSQFRCHRRDTSSLGITPLTNISVKVFQNTKKLTLSTLKFSDQILQYIFPFSISLFFWAETLAKQSSTSWGTSNNPDEAVSKAGACSAVEKNTLTNWDINIPGQPGCISYINTIKIIFIWSQSKFSPNWGAGITRNACLLQN